MMLFCTALRLVKHMYVYTYLFELLQIFNCPDNFVEVLRLQVKNKFLHF
jgi:hypothetical protein